VGPGSLGCDGCGGFWLDPSASRAIAVERRGCPVPFDAPVRRCPICASPLQPVPISAPVTVWLDRCAQHGAWFDADDLAAIVDPRLGAGVVRALLVEGERLDAAERAAIAASIQALLIGRGGRFVRPVGNPSGIILGLNAVHCGGVEAIAPDGRRERLLKGLSPWAWPGILGACGVFTVGATAIAMRNERGIVPILVIAFLALLFTAISGGALVFSFMKVRERLLFDAPRRLCCELRGSRPVLLVPARLMKATRLQVVASPGYADSYNLLVDCGFAELWIHQTTDATWARELAEKIARYMGIRFQAELQRAEPR
jgi:hypothetical protein